MMGVVNVYKEKGYTSHDVVAVVRRILGTKKVGHTGTLDPNATGVLPICVGRATKFADFFAAEDKTYIAEIVLGIETETGDVTGATTATSPVNFDVIAIQRCLQTFCKTYMQTPPMYSAIKINGQKLYELARQGKTVLREGRQVTISEITPLEFNVVTHTFSIRVKCSKGTYIRSLAVDIGKELGTLATMGELMRVQSGQFMLNHALYPALTLSEISNAVDNGTFKLAPIESLLSYPVYNLPEGLFVQASNGNPFRLPGHATGRFWAHASGRNIGLFQLDEHANARPVVML